MGCDFAALTGELEGWIRETVHSASMEGVVVGLSGGIDSAVAAGLAARALGAGSVLGLAMPCHSMKEDTRDGERLAKHLGIPFRVIDLTPVFDALVSAAGLAEASPLCLANLKARLRMTTLYSQSSPSAQVSGGRLVLGTSNYSEICVGYWTKWGDGASDLLPLGRLYKEEVRRVALQIGLPGWVLERVPSAGLWPGQSDEREMGVTYDRIETFLRGGDPGAEAAGLIETMVRATRHKREPVPFFDARGWMERHG
jgi:NAD+ synthase